MEIQKVTLPERRNPLDQFMSTAQLGMSAYSLLPQGAAAASSGGSSMSFLPQGSGGQGFNLGIGSSAAPTAPAAPTMAAPEVAAPSVSAGAEGSGGGGLWASGAQYAPPVAAGLMGAFQMKSNYDYQMKGNKAGNADYATKGGPALQWDSNTLSRRMEATKYLDPMKLKESMKTIESLDLPRADKDSMLGKISDALKLTKMIKIG